VTGAPPERATATGSSSGDGTGRRSGLTEAERAAALSTGTVPVDRTAAFRAGSQPVPRKVVVWITVALAVLALGGIALERLLGTAGVGTLASTPVTTLAGTGGAPPSAPVQPDVPPVAASAPALLGLTHLAGKPAPTFALSDQRGATWSPASARGKVVVLTFFDAACDDICPVLSSEISQADELLGAQQSRVEFVVVNADPLETSLAPTPLALTQPTLSGMANLLFLNGPLAELSRVWKAYGVTVAVDDTTRVVTHSQSMYFIDRTGRLVLSASPFANESSLGTYSLQPGVIAEFARGVSASASGLLRGAS
jgi:cytochrome oxidase Cu insertion factor (SCO1/SenC/PrrC family)